MNSTAPASRRPRQTATARSRSVVFASILMLGSTLCSGSDAAAPDRSVEVLDPAIALTSFDQVWNQVRDQYFDYSRIETDWESARSELRYRAATLTSSVELRALLNDLLARIGESHFSVIPGEFMTRLDRLRREDGKEASSQGPASTGLSVRLVDGQVRATEVIHDGPAWHAGIRAGWTLVAFDGEPLSELLAERASSASKRDARRARLMLELALHEPLTFPEAHRTLRLDWVDLEGRARQTELTGNPETVEWIQVGQLPPMAFEWQIDRIERQHHCVTRLAFSAWVPSLNQVLQARRDELMQCPALIIDLRGNLGGVISTMVALAADLFEQPVVLGSLLRGDGHFDFRVFPRKVAMDGQRLQPFEGPIAILVDSLSASTSEMFASGMQAQGRARVFGETTAGMALPARMLSLASGDSLMYAFADYRDGSGRRIEGVGVIPDVPISLSATHLEHPAHPPLTQALDWIADTLSGSGP